MCLCVLGGGGGGGGGGVCEGGKGVRERDRALRN